MNIKKYFLLLLSIFLFTGCTANYDLYIGDKIIDNLILLEYNDKIEGIDYYDMDKYNNFNIDNLSYQIFNLENGFNYSRKEIGIGNMSGYQYKYTYNFNEIKDKSMVYNCYDKIKISKNENIVIETSNEFRCFEEYNLLDEVNINIHYIGTLRNTNAHNYKDGIYTWKITKDNYKNAKIYLELEKYKKNYTLDIIGGVILFILIIILIFILKRNKNK